MATMIYHPDGKEFIWGIKCNFIVVEDSEVKSKLDDGWFLSPNDFPSMDSADSDGDGELSLQEARDYCKKHNIQTKGLHWKQIVKSAEEHINDNQG